MQHSMESTTLQASTQMFLLCLPDKDEFAVFINDVPSIDRASIAKLDHHDSGSSVANSIVQLVKLFSFETVAEGV